MQHKNDARVDNVSNVSGGEMGRECRRGECRRESTVATVANVVGKSLKYGSVKGTYTHTHTCCNRD